MISFFAIAMVTSSFLLLMSSRLPSFDPNFITSLHSLSSSFDPLSLPIIYQQVFACQYFFCLSLAVIALCANMAAARACSFQISNWLSFTQCLVQKVKVQFNVIKLKFILPKKNHLNLI